MRDIVRGETPKDFDVATDATPDTVQEIFPRTYAVGAHFGVIVVLESEFQFEVATFRSDDVYIDGRRPTAIVPEASPFRIARRSEMESGGRSKKPGQLQRSERSPQSW